MVETIINAAIQYGTYLAEAVVLLCVSVRARTKRPVGLSVYLGSLLMIDAVARPLVLHRWGYLSTQYQQVFYITDVVLALSAFLLVSYFYRQACAQEEKMWGVLRLTLVLVFLVVFGYSSFQLWRNFGQISPAFFAELAKILYFVCLVLNTFLYILLQQLESDDQELFLLVCGMGIQFAAPAATLALAILTPGRHPPLLFSYVAQLCTLGMLLVWFYAVALPHPKTVGEDGPRQLAGIGIAGIPKAWMD